MVSSSVIYLIICLNVSGHNYIGSEHLLLGLLREGEGVAARVLENLGADPNNIRTQASFNTMYFQSLWLSVSTLLHFLC